MEKEKVPRGLSNGKGERRKGGKIKMLQKDTPRRRTFLVGGNDQILPGGGKE